jgi:hypothetical protein
MIYNHLKSLRYKVISASSRHCWVLQTAETIVQGLNFPNLTPRLEKMPWSKMLFNNQSTSKNQCSEVNTMALAISFKFFLVRHKLPFFGQNCSLHFSLRSLDIPALLKSWKKH